MNSTIRLWDYGQTANKGAFVRQFTGHENKQFCLFSDFATSSGVQVVSGSEDNSLCIWDLQSKELLQVLKGHKCVPISVSCHPTAPIIATSSLEPENAIVLWADASTRVELPALGTSAPAAFGEQSASPAPAAASAAPAPAVAGGVKRPREEDGEGE